MELKNMKIKISIYNKKEEKAKLFYFNKWIIIRTMKFQKKKMMKIIIMIIKIIKKDKNYKQLLRILKILKEIKIKIKNLI